MGDKKRQAGRPKGRKNFNPNKHREIKGSKIKKDVSVFCGECFAQNKSAIDLLYIDKAELIAKIREKMETLGLTGRNLLQWVINVVEGK